MALTELEIRAAKALEKPLKLFDGGGWRIPGDRMKMRELHIVPLATQAVSR